jgi:hypothetical protein
VAEQLALEQALHQRAAVDGDERPAAASTAVVQGAGDDLLADAAVTRDQHVGVGSGDLVDGLAQVGHRGRPTDQVGVGQLVAHHRVLATQAVFVESARGDHA